MRRSVSRKSCSPISMSSMQISTKKVIGIQCGSYLKISMFKYVVSSHPVQYELGLIGDPNDVISHGMGQQATLVDQLYERQPGVLLQRVLPLLGAKQHHQLHYRGAGLEGLEAWQIELVVSNESKWQIY